MPDRAHPICVHLRLGAVKKKPHTTALLDDMTSLCEERGTLGDETRSLLVA